MNDNNERIFKELAKRYLDAQGDNLHKEMTELSHLEKTNTSRMDYMVYNRMRKKRRWWVYAASGLAACFLLLVMIGSILTLSSMFFVGKTNENPQMLELNVELPERLSVSTVELDRGQMIYKLIDRDGDNVVLTLESQKGKMDTSGMKSLNTSGYTVYYVIEDYYYLVSFKQKDVLYTMTCHYEMDTLLELSEIILQQL